MNERVKAILVAALKLPPEEQQELADTLVANLGTDPAEAEQLFAADDTAESDDVPVQPTSDVLAKYLDI